MHILRTTRKRVEDLEKPTGKRLVEIPQYRVLIDGEEKIMRPLDYAYATTAEGREGKIIGRAQSVWEPVNPHPDFSALNAAFEGMKLTDVQAEIRERMEQAQL